MKSKHPSIRVFGQRSIIPSVVYRSSNSGKELTDAKKKESNRQSSASLSDFLDRKLKRSPGLPKPVVQEKSRPFTSLLVGGDSGGPSVEKFKVSKRREEEKSDVLNKVVFEQFKSCTEKVDSVHLSSATEEENTSELPGTRKRRNPFEGVNEKATTRKPVLILGDHASPMQKEKVENESGRKKPRPLYNHYSNGSGWWDSDMVGLDSEEVGLGEVWEGVGSTTYGGVVDWH